MKQFTINEFVKNFDDLLTRVENGETFLIKSDSGNVIITPYNTSIFNCDDEIVKIHRDHEEGC